MKYNTSFVASSGLGIRRKKTASAFCLYIYIYTYENKKMKNACVVKIVVKIFFYIQQKMFYKMLILNSKKVVYENDINNRMNK